jgi:flagellin
MSLRINTNVAALNSYNNLSANQTKLESAFQQLSSGLRINKAADDAAGLSIAQGLTSQINGLTQAVSNANDGINDAQIADGALGTVQDILQRMRGLVVKAGNVGTQDADSLTAIQKEIKNLNTQLTNINDQTKFGQTNILDGTYNKNFQVGANGGDTIALDLSKSVVTATNIGGTNTGTSASPAYAGGTNLTTMTIAAATFNSTTGYTTANATSDLGSIDTAIGAISTARSQIGAVQNQLNYTVTNLQTAITNVTASRSNLTDADLAQQVTAMTQSQILTQAATSVLAQANSAPQAILKLLQ